MNPIDLDRLKRLQALSSRDFHRFCTRNLASRSLLHIARKTENPFMFINRATEKTVCKRLEGYARALGLHDCEAH